MHTSDASSIVLDFVTVHANLVTSNHCFEAVVLAEPLGDVGPELHSDASFAGTSTRFILRISPQHLHHEAGLAGLPLVVSVELSNIVQCHAIIREETAVEDQIFFADQRGQWKSRETL